MKWVTITDCSECPKRGTGMGIGSARCNQTGKMIKDLVAGFPDTCPLHDVPDWQIESKNTRNYTSGGYP